ncbi:hypothetical protein Xant_21875 [Xanthomonas cissicola]|nr:hypothetical protein Xant_21875 [Xanthomonas cissicola]
MKRKQLLPAMGSLRLYPGEFPRKAPEMAKFRRSERHSSERRDIPHPQASLFRPSLTMLEERETMTCVSLHDLTGSISTA